MGAVLRNLSQYESILQLGLYRSLLTCLQLRGPRILSSPKAHLASGRNPEPMTGPVPLS